MVELMALDLAYHLPLNGWRDDFAMLCAESDDASGHEAAVSCP